MLVTLVAVNVVTLVGIVELFYPLPAWSGMSKFGKLIVYVVMAVPQYFVILFAGKYKAIIQRYSPESPAQRWGRGRLVLLYVIASLVAPIALAVVAGIKDGTLF